MAQLDPNDGTTPTWWDQQPPPPPTTTAATPTMPTGPVTDPHDPRLSDPAHGNDPEVLAWLNSRYDATGTSQTKPTPTSVWNPQTQAWEDPAKTTDPTTGKPPGPNPVTTGPGPMVQSGYGGFGIAPAPYTSDPNPPGYTPLPTYAPPTWTGGDFVNPTEADLVAMPGYQSQLDAGLQARERSAAAQGTVLNGGTLKAEDRFATDYAATGYQTLRNNTLQAYQQKYQQFTDAAGMDLNARTLNANNNQNTYTNNLNTYTAGNARTLSDYLTNVNAQRNAKLDYWSQLQDTSNTGANLAGGSR